MSDFIYDLETYPNCFTATFMHPITKDAHVFELSDYRNDSSALTSFLYNCQTHGHRLVGFNNINFDYPIIHQYMVSGCSMNHVDLYDAAMRIINNTGKFNPYTIWPNQELIRQIDLYKICHFDNKSRRTSLKVLEFNMRRDSVEDLPIPVGTTLTREQIINQLIPYNLEDVKATADFYLRLVNNIAFRESIHREFGIDCLNFNDTKIGKEYFIKQLEAAAPGSCYYYENRKRQKRQTHREFIDLRDVVLPCVEFTDPEFRRIHNFFMDTRLDAYELNGVFKDLTCETGELVFSFGLGGVHASVDNESFAADDEYEIIDLDVASYYPNLAIKNGFYPEHLGEIYCQEYEKLYEMRKSYPKGSPENAILKLALNGTYGDSNNIYSPFYDPQYTMATTVNGQLLLCMLAEKLMGLPNTKILQVNTDGLTILSHRINRDQIHTATTAWEMLTGLELESVDYSRMMIRDVNNYIAEGIDGSLKLKGAYQTVAAMDAKAPGKDGLDWHQDHSNLASVKAAVSYLIKGDDPSLTLAKNRNPFEFCLLAKVKRGSELFHGQEKIQKTTRYYVSVDGQYLQKMMPPLASKPEKYRFFAINKGYKTTISNKISDFRFDNVDYNYYLQKAMDLIKGVGK